MQGASDLDEHPRDIRSDIAARLLLNALAPLGIYALPKHFGESDFFALGAGGGAKTMRISNPQDMEAVIRRASASCRKFLGCD